MSLLFAALANFPLQKSQSEGRNAVKINYSPTQQFTLCGASLIPVMGHGFVRCPLCGTAYKPDFSGQICQVCDIPTIGVETVGLTCMALQ